LTLVVIVGFVGLAALSFGEDGGWFDDFLSEEYEGTSVAADAELGDCFARQDLTASESAAVACDDAHAIEVYVRRPALGDENTPYPAANLDFLGDEICMAEFEPYVSRSYFDSSLDYVTLVPSRAAWNEGEHDIVCGLYDLDGRKLEGTSKGSGR
jgi:hypothetical protein